MMIERFTLKYRVPGAHERGFGAQIYLGKELTMYFPRIYDLFTRERHNAVDEAFGIVRAPGRH